jgi:hypothetical protein
MPLIDINFPSVGSELVPAPDPVRVPDVLQSGDEYTANGKTWVYDASIPAWKPKLLPLSGTNTGDETTETILAKIGDGERIGAEYMPDALSGGGVPVAPEITIGGTQGLDGAYVEFGENEGRPVYTNGSVQLRWQADRWSFVSLSTPLAGTLYSLTDVAVPQPGMNWVRTGTEDVGGGPYLEPFTITQGPPPGTETRVASYIGQLYRNTYPDPDTWYRWDGSAWQADAGGTVDNAAVNVAIAEDPGATRDAAEISRNGNLARFRRAMTRGRKASILCIGDSMIGTAQDALYAQVLADFGLSGQGFVSAGHSNGTVLNGADMTRWISGLTYSVPLNGEIEFAEGGIKFAEGDTLKLYYVIEPGAGKFKVQTQKEGGSFTDETGIGTAGVIDANGTLAGGVITITKSDYRARWKFKVIGLGDGAGGAGTVTIIGGGIRDSLLGGALLTILPNSSNGSNNINHALATPAAILNPIIADLAPNLVILSHYDGASVVNAAQAEYQDRLIEAATTITSGTAFTADASTNLITQAGHSLVTGELVRLVTDGTLPEPLSTAETYIVRVNDANSFYLCADDIEQEIDITDAGSGTHGRALVHPPSFICVGPTLGYTVEQDALAAAQSAAMRDLAAQRGDAFWDNRQWALEVDDALANGYTYGVHYTQTASGEWVPRMFSALGVATSIKFGKNNPVEFRPPGGGTLRAYKPQYKGTFPGIENLGFFVLAKDPDGASGQLLLEDTAGPISSIDFGKLYYTSNVLTMEAQGYKLGWNAAALYSDFSTAAAPSGSLGTAAKPWTVAYLGKTITATGTTGDRTINRAHGTVRFAAASATPIVVTNSFATTSANIIAQVYGTDATLTSVRITKNTGNFTITPNAAADAETEVGWLILP